MIKNDPMVVFSIILRCEVLNLPQMLTTPWGEGFYTAYGRSIPVSDLKSDKPGNF